jgi:hypothetical protein
MSKQRLLLFFLFGTIVLALLMRWQGATLQQSPETKAGIVALELAGNKENARHILAVWENASVIQVAFRNTQLDFIFLFFYSLFLYIACFQLSLVQQGWMQTTSQTLSLSALFAGCCDVVENGLMLQQLQQDMVAWVYPMTYVVALIKFLLLVVVVIWILFSLLQQLFRKQGS